MDIHDYITAVTNHMAQLDHGVTQMYTWYLFSDPRPGEPCDKFLADAKEYAEYQAMFRV
jgi:hypothetical protein